MPGLVGMVAVLVLLAAPALARRGPAPGADPAGAQADRLIARKLAVEQTKARVEQSLQAIRSGAAAAPPGESRVALEAQLLPLERQARDALWTYNVGNYDEAIRQYAALERNARGTQLLCDRVRQSVERCAKALTGALDRIRSWGLKIARIQEPAQRARCENALAAAEQTLLSLEKSCAATDPAWVVRQIPPAVKPLDDLLRQVK